jgi:hypothetical protein
MHQHIAAATQIACTGQGHSLGESDRDRRVDGIAAPAQDFDPYL